jgi:hypothetical protein
MTNVISDVSQKKFETELKIRDISLSIFPPGIEFNDVDISKKISPNEFMEAELGKIGIYLGLIEMEEKNITLGEIKISESYIKYVGPEKNEELKEIDRKIIDQIFKVPDQLPIRLDTVVIENTKIFYNYDLLEAKRLKLYKKDKSFITRFHLAHIKPHKDALHTIDEIWGDGEISKNDISIYRVKIQQDVQTVLIKGKIKDYYKLKSASAEINGEMNVYLPNILNDLLPKSESVVREGSGRVGFKLNYKDENLQGDADIFLKEVDSIFVTASEIRSTLKIENDKIKISRLKLENDNESLDLLSPVDVYDFEKKKIPAILLEVNAKIGLKTMKRIIPAMLDVLQNKPSEFVRIL